MSEIVQVDVDEAFTVDGHRIRRDGEMWCMTDLWRASGSPKERRPAEWLRYDGAAFVDFLRDTLDVGQAHIVKTARKGGAGGGGDTWGHWQIALAYAKALSHPFHARVNEVYRAFVAGQLVPKKSSSDEELIRLQLRLKALDKHDYRTVWDTELKMELARLRKLKWNGSGQEPGPQLRYAYGRVWRIILGDKTYEELKRRNPDPRDGSLHGQWLQEQRYKIAKQEDLVIALVLARRATRWAEYEREMRSHFRRTPIQLRLVAGSRSVIDARP